MIIRNTILAAILATALSSCAVSPDEAHDTITVVGTDTNGIPIQQVVWLHRNPDLKERACPIWAGTPVIIVADRDAVVKIKADKTALPDEDKWHEAILKGNIVVGWIDTKFILQIPIDVWNENKREPNTNLEPISGSQ